MDRRERVRFRFAWISLAVIGLAIFAFGLFLAVWPGPSDVLPMRGIGVASVGMGLFGLLIALIPFRRRERWAWFSLWYYLVFWLAHLLGGLPPGQDHVHQFVFIALALSSLLISAGEFFE